MIACFGVGGRGMVGSYVEITHLKDDGGPAYRSDVGRSDWTPAEGVGAPMGWVWGWGWGSTRGQCQKDIRKRTSVCTDSARDLNSLSAQADLGLAGSGGISPGRGSTGDPVEQSCFRWLGKPCHCRGIVQPAEGAKGTRVRPQGKASSPGLHWEMVWDGSVHKGEATQPLESGYRRQEIPEGLQKTRG